MPTSTETPAPPAATPDQPARPLATGQGARLDNLDFIRGIAVMGILFANMAGFGQPMEATMHPGAFLVPHGPLSDGLWAVQYVLIDGKMRGLFSMLFGAGMWLFLEKAWARGQDADLQARRLFWLLLFGLAHFYLVWRGDILALYAVCGFIMLLFLKLRPRAQIVTALAIYAVGQVLYAMMSIPAWLMLHRGDGGRATEKFGAFAQTLKADGAVETALLRSGDWPGLVAHNFAEHGTEPLTAALFVGFETIPFMLLGMALYRLGLFSGGFDRRRQLRWGWAGILLGGAASVAGALWALQEGLTFWGVQVAFLAISDVPRLTMALGLLAVLAVHGHGRDGWFGQRVRAAGRVAFSNYLGTSLVMMLVFQGWAGGLYGQLSRPALYGVAIVGCVLMLAWSKPWLDRFRFGPLEWVWRCLTYWRVFALRR